MTLVNLSPSAVAVNIAEDIQGADTVTAVSALSTVTVALAANASRAYYSIFNAGTQTVYLRENATVSATLYKHPIPPNHLLEREFTGTRYTGVVSVITASGTSNLMVAESSIVP
ncbi:hypothetical protein D0A34_09630 [Microcoleus vaginatus PCC 9802]|uniref:hypothetical protein n=1 Tax=Microcoleus vaginatus TaxID=119532 RepID=UPI00020D1D88|nr:hypothetical protein MicvaDRAFT_0032 [Microcoleus vaginatus FGP-2]UNU19095.1 hypothetical protein D0A34_09630 [Microcoleus vaginatus PCC 9802]